ncbi:MAG TPA: hypothetical protein VF219_12465 [Vicinamibacterales bacterium]
MGERQRTQSGEDQAVRDQEVMRANRELAAYFRGRRTEREARAALKVLRAYVRARARMDPKARPPLPSAKPAAKERIKKQAPQRRPASRRTAPRRLVPVAVDDAEASAGPLNAPQDSED